MIPEQHKQLLREHPEYYTEILLPVLIYVSKKAYSRYFSKEAKKCEGRSGFKRSRCIVRAKIRGLAAQIQELKKLRTKCETKKRKESCSKSVDKKIGELRAKRFELTKSLIDFRHKERAKGTT